jgi:glucose/arabinose dehydrogenase
MRAPVLSLYAIAALGGCGDSVVPPDPRPFGLTLQAVAEGLVAPVFATAPDGDSRLFIVERNGRIRILANGALLAEPFLDLRSRVNFVGERGMLSMAFHPQYASNGRFFVYYVDLQGDIAIEGFTSTPGSSVAGASEGLVLGIPHGRSEHHGGLAAFGPDGMLYIATGDGACCGDPFDNAQDVSSLLGKILRIDVAALPYTIPPGNPYIGVVGARAEIWAVGLRSPWRFSFDVPTGTLLLGDVGQDAHEEINIVPANAAGINYGWPFMEGTACYRPTIDCDSGEPLTIPAVHYEHTLGCSVIGGHVYRGAAIPELAGQYVYSDYCGGWLRSFNLTTTGPGEHQLWTGVHLPGAVSFGRDGSGELYLIGNGGVFRIVPD